MRARLPPEIKTYREHDKDHLALKIHPGLIDLFEKTVKVIQMNASSKESGHAHSSQGFRQEGRTAALLLENRRLLQDSTDPIPSKTPPHGYATAQSFTHTQVSLLHTH